MQNIRRAIGHNCDMKCSCFLSLCTGQLESVHSMYAKYATKRKKFFRESQAKDSWTGAEPQRPQSHYKSRARPGAVQTPVFKRCRRKLRRAEKGQTFRKDIVSGVLCRAESGSIWAALRQHTTETTHTLEQQKGVETPNNDSDVK